jgi:putative CocE/NonD family hydrolase
MSEVGLPASLAGFEDEAAFDVIVNEERIGTARSSWRVDGAFEGSSALTVGGQTARASIRVTPDADGRWREIVTVSGDGTRSSTRVGTSVTRHFKGELRELTSTYETPPGAVLFDRDAPALLSQALRSYDRTAGGTQTFPVLIGGRPPVSLEVRIHEREGGSDLARFDCGLPGMDLVAWADRSGKLCRLELPAVGVAFIREGHVPRRAAAASGVSAPAFEVEVQRNVAVPMRDGLMLATDVYCPVGVARAPVILARTPYKKELLEIQARFYARRGYVFAAQDCRGCFASPGTWEPFMHEGQDGHDSIEWLSTRPYASGTVGTIGGSYLALAQWLAAAEHPPHLTTMVVNVSPTDPFGNIPYEHGAFALAGVLWWADVLESRAAADLSGAALSRIRQKRVLDKLRGLPVIDLDRAVLGSENPYWRRWIMHPSNDDYWSPAAFLERLADVDLPVFHQSGWYDGDGIGTKRNYQRMAACGHAHQKLTLGPWGHTDTATRMVGSRDFGPDAVVDLQRDYLRWFDCWLKGVDNGIDREPMVSLFVMGENTWRRGNAYPLEGATFRKLFLASAGRLTFAPPTADSPPDRYTYDPADPTPTARLYEEPEEDEARVRTAAERLQAARDFQRRISERPDVLLYQTERLDRPLTFAGPLSAVLYASSSARDTDWFVTLSEVDESGDAFPLVTGKVRARYRDSIETPTLIEPGRVYEYVVDLWQTGIAIPAGRRLRVEVASAAFPLCSRNLNTGGHNETETDYVVARQTLFHDERYPSHILLPVMPGRTSG